jgi:hypothetical protein
MEIVIPLNLLVPSTKYFEAILIVIGVFKSLSQQQ